jgi:acyl-CoA hydrolase
MMAVMAEPRRPRAFESPEEMVEWTLSRVGPRVVLGTPLALGKPNQLVNAFYRRAEQDPAISLTIYTALSLAPPAWSSDLERRLVEPMVERLWGGYPALAWVEPMRRGELPSNVDVREFYFRPGVMLGSPAAQRSYISTNYSHVVRDVLAGGLNVLAQAVGAEEVDGQLRYSLSCNSDLTVDLLPRLRAAERAGQKLAVLAQVNRRLPFLYGDAMVSPDAFDATLDGVDLPLFGTPNLPIDTTDYRIALHVSALIKDGGTLQLGIGSLGDAIVAMLQLRHEDNGTYRRLLGDCGIASRWAGLIDGWGGAAPFARGLYASSEMLIDGFLDLWKHGILKRKVYPHAALQRLLDAGQIQEEVSVETLAALVEAGAVEARPGERDVALLRELGILRADVELVGERLVAGERTAPADLSTAAGRAAVAELLGERLRGGRLVHSCFFLGPDGFYQALRDMPREERELIEMTGISFVNELYGQEELKRAQRRHARFVNTGLMATLLGAVVSDGLEDGRVVSGVGGQYNFVAMAHELEEGRSILMIRSTREHEGEVRSNVVWRYGHATIPRHLRDLVVTEYGIADLRGKSDEEVVAAMLAVADSRFQEDLLEQAKRAGKIAAGYRLPDPCRENTPERLERQLAPYRERGMFSELPYGTDLTPEEVTLAKALRRLKARVKNRDLSLFPDLEEIQQILSVPEAARPYLERMGLAEPEGLHETLLQRAVVFALISDGAL